MAEEEEDHDTDESPRYEEDTRRARRVLFRSVLLQVGYLQVIFLQQLKQELQSDFGDSDRKTYRTKHFPPLIAHLAQDLVNQTVFAQWPRQVTIYRYEVGAGTIIKTAMKPLVLIVLGKSRVDLSNDRYRAELKLAGNSTLVFTAEARLDVLVQSQSKNDWIIVLS